MFYSFQICTNHFDSGSVVAPRSMVLCICILRITSGPRVKMSTAVKVLYPTVVYVTDSSKVTVPMVFFFYVALCFILRDASCIGLPCSLFTSFTRPLALWSPWGSESWSMCFTCIRLYILHELCLSFFSSSMCQIG